MSTDAQREVDHKGIASQCFNAVWELLEQSDRSLEENETMIHLSHTSFWHWTQVPDHTAANISVGYWQLSRVYAAAGRYASAEEFGVRCLQKSTSLEPFYLGYAHEALARAYAGLDEWDKAREHLSKAQELLSKIQDKDSAEYLKQDLDGIHRILAEA
jgi:tetratricopeptide (TPR) repeat protein